MKIERTVRPHLSIFEKQQTKIVVSGVTPAKAEELFTVLGSLRFRQCGDKGILELYIEADNFWTGDNWKTQSDCDHFLAGYELGMLLNGVDIKGNYGAPFRRLPA